ncbi:MerR family DNA-binding transcriptional regulator [Uliginosibacterium sediminicola]|uniref:MerR family DNA-binding transcriptional regulator n=1 Tax=Uliginosibacterium sediminicola TaxID=2024550 RepID=A0ABU9YWM0_9RHOO
MILIGELARLLGVTSRTLRHYEQIDLFPRGGRHSTRAFTHLGPVSTAVDTYRQIWESLEPVWQLRHSLGPQFELHDERFKGPLDPASEVDIHIPVL